MIPVVEEPSGQTTKTPFNEPEQWFLTAAERGNTHTILDSRHADGVAWTTGNQARALIDGRTYFHELFTAVQAMKAGDLLMFTDWRGDPDERLAGPGTEVAKVFADAARRGVDVRGLLWRSHSDHAQFSASENRRFDDIVDEAGGQCLLDMRVRPLGSHHSVQRWGRGFGHASCNVAELIPSAPTRTSAVADRPFEKVAVTTPAV